MIINGDCLVELKNLVASSVDTIITDPPYGYSFMGKDWDKAVPSVEIWQECLRVLKPGAFCCVMSAPRSDVQNAMISRLMEAGFRLDFTPIYWTYASGFPKAGNMGKLVDKRMGVEREVIGASKYANRGRVAKDTSINLGTSDASIDTAPATPQAKQLDGSYAGFQPKPAVEVIIVAMKPLSEKTYVDQALANGHGVSWLDDCRVPTDTLIETGRNSRGDKATFQASELNSEPQQYQSSGRFPANLLVSDDVLNDGVDHVTHGSKKYVNMEQDRTKEFNTYGKYGKSVYKQDTAGGGSYSRYFDLDKWATTLPFLITPKASKSEKNAGLDGITCTHPTVKPLKLMSYLITLFSRPGDTVLDPFVGSGTTVVAAENLGRKGIGIEREAEYAEIARARLNHAIPQIAPEKPEPAAPPVTIEGLTQMSMFV